MHLNTIVKRSWPQTPFCKFILAIYVDNFSKGFRWTIKVCSTYLQIVLKILDAKNIQVLFPFKCYTSSQKVYDIPYQLYVMKTSIMIGSW